MAYFAAILRMADESRNQAVRPAHLEYLASLEQQGKIHGKGPFTDGSGGMVVYIADSLEDARQLAEADPYVAEKVRSLELHEWKLG
jgi:uncharacterized protein